MTFYYHLLLMSAAASVLYLVLKLLSKWTQKHFTATWHYYTNVLIYTLFIIPYFKLLFVLNLKIPGAVPIKLEAHSIAAPIQKIIQESSLPIIIQDGSRYMATDQASHEASYPVLNLLPFIPYVLGVGTIVFLAVTIIQNVKIHRRIFSLCEETYDPDVLRELSTSKRKLGITRETPVYLSPYISTPFLYGMFKPRIVLPAAMEFTSEEYAQVFLHELTHYKRRDIWVKCLLIGINALHWFNPVAYMARRDIDRYCELSCDEQIVQTMNSTERRRYCELLLNVLWNVADQKVKLYSAFSDKRNYLERRISMILKHDGSKKKKSVRMLAVTMTLSMALIGTGAVYAGSEKGKIEDLTGFNLNNSAGDGTVTIGKVNGTFGTSLDDLNRVNIQKEKGDGAVSVIEIEDGAATFGSYSSSDFKMVNIVESNGDGEVTLVEGASSAQFLDTLPENALGNANPEVAKSNVTNELSSSAQQFSGNLNQDKGYNNKKLTLDKGSSVIIEATWDRPQDFQVGIYSHETGNTYFETLSDGSDSVTFDILASGEYSIYVGNPSVGSPHWKVKYEVH
ncbi:MAG: M56 family metallopeptidase [Paenibacillus dendritiformis]|uniref:M56 family metallopeptidase n=1 Tax=uncultured Paenibacillus sp. TaxID=227322 RepID=UPI0025D2273C|nr:M56 family metallopeptidase [uncultured Paenibacillus sp.]MDU5145417.1 M56 family metallopeptidase [Paenibacillus dendritiformis]